MAERDGRSRPAGENREASVPGLITVELALTADQADLLWEMVDSAADVFADMEEHHEDAVRVVAGLVRNAVAAARGKA